MERSGTICFQRKSGRMWQCWISWELLPTDQTGGGYLFLLPHSVQLPGSKQSMEWWWLSYYFPLNFCFRLQFPAHNHLIVFRYSFELEIRNGPLWRFKLPSFFFPQFWLWRPTNDNPLKLFVYQYFLLLQMTMHNKLYCCYFTLVVFDIVVLELFRWNIIKYSFLTIISFFLISLAFYWSLILYFSSALLT